MDPLEKFQPHIPVTLGITALQGSNNRKINLYSKYRENKSQVLAKTIVTYKHRVQICTILFIMRRVYDYWVSVSLYHLLHYIKWQKLVKIDGMLLFRRNVNKRL